MTQFEVLIRPDSSYSRSASLLSSPVMVKIKSYKKHLLKELSKPEEAAAYLNAALQDDDSHAFLLALRDIAEAQGGMSHLAEEAELNRENLYRTLSLRGNPKFFNLLAILDAVGLELSIHAKRKQRRTRAQL